MPEMEQEVQQLEEKYKDLEQLKVLEGKIVELKKEIAWAQVIELEKVSLILSHPEALLWQVKSSGFRQSKITKCPLLVNLGGKGLKIL